MIGLGMHRLAWAKPAVRFNIMGLCCSVIHYLPQAEHRHQRAYTWDCHLGFMEALGPGEGWCVLWST